MVHRRILQENPEIRYLVRQKTHSLSVHGETAVTLRTEIAECLDGKNCDYDHLVNLVELFIDTIHKAESDAKELLNTLRVLRMVDVGGSR